MKILGVIFDLDGVIVSTDNCHYLAWKRMADEEGIYFDRKINERLRGVSRMESLEIVLERAQKSYTAEQKQALAQRKNDYYVELIKSLSKADILSGALDTFELLRRRGIKIAIGSSSKNTPLILKQIGLENAFDAVADGNAITHSKPDPEVFLLGAKLLGLPPENCLVVEDADAGIEAAVAGGMRALGVGSAAGNPNATYSAENLAKAGFETILAD
ncbi:MAG: beta-phosphoglucomutase [Clostridiales bacterium]|nr:beta-phosphoglucomutase [Clostridiales bacterium]